MKKRIEHAHMRRGEKHELVEQAARLINEHKLDEAWQSAMAAMSRSSSRVSYHDMGWA